MNSRMSFFSALCEKSFLFNIGHIWNGQTLILNKSCDISVYLNLYQSVKNALRWMGKIYSTISESNIEILFRKNKLTIKILW